MAAVAPTHIMSTPSGSPQSAPKTAAVTPQTMRMEVSPVRAMASSFPHTMALGRIGAAASRASVPVDALHQERAHAEAAADEEEDHRDGRREVVEDGLAAVAQRARRDRDGGAVGGRPGCQAAGVEPARQSRRHRLGVPPARPARSARSTTSKPGEGVAPGATIGMRRSDRLLRPPGTPRRPRPACRPPPPAARPPRRATSRTTTLSRELAGVHGGPHQRRRCPRDPDGHGGGGGVAGEGEARGWRRWRAAPPGR